MRSIALAAVAALAATSSAYATILYDSNGFESPTFVPGSVGGQDGWFVDPAGHTQHQVVSGAQGTVAPIGSQMLRVQQTTATRWSFPDISGDVVTRPVGENVIWNEFALNLPTVTTSTAGFGVLAYDASLATIGGVRVRGSDAALIVTLDPDGASPTFAFGSYTIGLTVPRDTWINLGIAVNVVTGELSITSGGTALITGTAGGAFATLSDFDAISGSSTTTTDSIYLDEYIIQSVTAIPEPATAALGIAALGLLHRRRQR